MKMQKEVGILIREFILEQETHFQEIQGGSFVMVDTGEFFTRLEHDKYIQRKLEEYKVHIFTTTNHVALNEFGIENKQKLSNKSSKSKKKSKTREKFDNGEFNIVYREKLMEVITMKLTNNEKLVYYILRDFVQYPTNYVMVADAIPTTKQLEKLIGLSEKSIIGSLKSLEDKSMIKRVQVGRKKAIVVNPEYYASGKELDVDTLVLFGLADMKQDVVDSYFEKCDL